MRKIIKKTAFFVLPFFILYLITMLFYGSSSSSPDLLRVGYFPVFKEYRTIFQNEFNRKFYFNKISKTKNKRAKILTIGDSFSEQGTFGYKNYLAENYSVLHVDRFIARNQIQTLYQFLNSSFFEEYNVEYVILENVERLFVANANALDDVKIKFKPQFNRTINSSKSGQVKETNAFFSKETVYFPFSMFRFYFDHNYLSNNIVYNVTLKTEKLFSNNSNRLLFFSEDLLHLKQNNDLAEVKKLNSVLNNLSERLSRKKVKLIVLPAPDKYDLYYYYISDKTNFPKPLFFQHLECLKKDYLYIDSKKILTSQLESRKDIYFYDDTHWSPVASKIISDEIIKIIIK